MQGDATCIKRFGNFREGSGRIRFSIVEHDADLTVQND